MVYQAGSAQVSVTPDMSGFHKDIQAKMEAEGDDAGKSFGDAFTTRVRASFAGLSGPTLTATADTAAAAAQFDTLARDRTAAVDADAETAAATVRLDALTRDRTVRVRVREDAGRGLSGLLSGAGEGGGALGGAGQPLLLAGAGTVLAGLLPAAAGTTVGAGFAGLGLLAAAKFSKSLQKGLQQTGRIFEGTLATAVAPLGSAFESLLPSIDSFISSMGPQLQAAFSASIPFMREFVTAGEDAAQSILPAFTDLMDSLAPELPQIGQAFDSLIQGVSGFLEVLGPGMRESVTVFKAAADVVSFAMVAIGGTAEGIAVEFAYAGHGINVAISKIAAVSEGTARTVKAGWELTVNFFRELPGAIAGIFSGAGSLLVSAGRRITGGLGSGVRGAWNTVAGFFESVPGRIRGVFAGAGSWLISAGRALVDGFAGAIGGMGGVVANALLDLVPSPVRGLVSGALGIFGFASGTPSAPAGWALVGERGPELVKFSGGERVLSSSASARSLAGIASAQSLSALSGLRVPAVAVPSLPGVGTSLSGQALNLNVTYTGPSGGAIEAIISDLRYSIRDSGGGDVQAHLGRGPVRLP